MKKMNLKKTFVTMNLAALILAVSLTSGLINKHSTTAAAVQTTGVVLPKSNIYFLNDDNVLFVLTPGSLNPTRLARVTRIDGNLIGIDFRPADNALYGLTDTGKLYTISVTGTNLGAATPVSSLTTRFAGGFQSLMDFNPVLNAVRLIGTNDQNFAVVNSNGNLNAMAVQTAMTYAAGDVNAGVDPNIAGGTYSNNYVGAPNTLFYALDYDLDTLVTIATVSATGSSNTGGGQLKTFGRLTTADGKPFNVSPVADLDLFTDAGGINTLVGVSGRTLFTIDLGQINPSLPLGQTQNIVVNSILMTTPGGFVDVAVSTIAGTTTPPPTSTPTPTPAPTPTPTPAPVVLQAEAAFLGGGNRVATTHAGFTGTGYVDYADNIAGGVTEFSVTQTGAKTLTFRYANGSTVNRNCALTINGANVGTLSFTPTGAWTTWKTTSITVNLGTTTGRKGVRLTSTTTAGGPNLDRLDVQ